MNPRSVLIVDLSVWFGSLVNSCMYCITIPDLWLC